MILFLFACFVKEDIIIDTANSDCVSPNYYNFGDAFMTQYCLGCHASESLNREGAPTAVTLESLENILEYREAIIRVLQEEVMPPQGGIAEDMRHTAEEWLDCLGEVQ